jgi:hypothetical protein
MALGETSRAATLRHAMVAPAINLVVRDLVMRILR